MRALRKVGATYRNEFRETIKPETAERIIEWQQTLPDGKRNDALMDDCLSVLATVNLPEVNLADKERIWRDIVKSIGVSDEYSVRESNARKRGYIASRPILASLIACCLLFVTASITLASGLLPWRLTINRENGYFEIQILPTKMNRRNKAEISNTALHGDYVHRLNELGIEVNLPKYWPKDYAYSSIEENYPDEPGTYVVCYYSHGESNLNICVDLVTAEDYDINDYSLTYEMSGEDVITYSGNNAVYHIYHNESYVSAVWIDGECIVSITGNISEEEMRSILDSIDSES